MNDLLIKNSLKKAISYPTYRKLMKDLIEKNKTKIWSKYMVGSFKTYKNAADYRDKLRNTAPGAFIVVFEKGKQVSITEQMKM